MENSTLKQAIKLINTPHTHILEFGVYKGESLKQLRRSIPPNYKTFGFDSWEGFPEDWTGAKGKNKKGDLKCEIPKIEKTKLYKGWFTDTIPQYKKIAEPFALLHVDCDLYSSTITVLYELNKYIVPGTIIVFDEWYYNHKDIEVNRQHEQKAFYEWVKDKNREYIIYDEVEGLKEQNHDRVLYNKVKTERKIVKILK